MEEYWEGEKEKTKMKWKVLLGTIVGYIEEVEFSAVSRKPVSHFRKKFKCDNVF